MNLNDNLWQLFNQYSFKGVMIISHGDFKREIERICIQSGNAKSTSSETNHSQQEPVLHSHTEKVKGRRVSEKVVASRIGESRLPDADVDSTEAVA